MTWFLLLLALLLLAAVPVVLLVLWSRITALERRLGSLERAVAAVRGELWTGAAQQAQPRSAEDHPSAPAVTPAVVPLPEQPAPVLPAPDPESSPSRPAPVRGEWEALVGGKLLNRIGALALVIGLGFFLSYAFDRDWIPEAARVMLGGAVGAACLVLARRARKRSYAVFAQGLTGAGIAILYLAVYASFNYYALVPRPAAFILMSLVTLAGFLEAHRTDSLAVALLAWAGGTLTPVLLAAGEPNAAGLFTYTALLTAGVLALVALREDWLILHPLSLAAAYLFYLVWLLDAYEPALFALALFFLVIFWGLFAAIEMVQVVQMSSRLSALKQLLAGANTLLAVVCLFRLMETSPLDLLAPALVLMGGVYAVQRAGFAGRLDAVPGAAARLEVTAAALLVLATDAQFERYSTVVLWSIEAYVLALIALGRSSRPLSVTAHILLVITILRFLAVRGTFGMAEAPGLWPLLNERAIAGITLVAVLVRVAALGAVSSAAQRGVRRLLEAAGVVLVVLLVSVETADVFARLEGAAWISGPRLNYLHLVTHPVLWMGIAVFTVAAGMHRRASAFLPMGLLVGAVAIAGALALGLSYAPLTEFRLLVNERVAVLLLVGAGAWGIGRIVGHGAERGGWEARVATGAAVAVVVLALAGVTGETRDLFGRTLAELRETVDTSPGQLAVLEDQKQLALSGAWILFSVALMGLGIARRRRIDRVLAFVLFGVTILKIFLYDLSLLDTLYRIFSFMGLGLVLLGVSWLFQRYRERIFGGE